MRRPTMRWSFLLATAVVLAACGGGSGSSPAASADDGGGTTASTAPDATTPPDATTAPDATVDAGGGGGSTAGDFSGKMCDLVTLDEMNAVAAIPADAQQENAFVQGSGQCIFTAQGGATPVGAISLIGGSTTDARVAFEAYKASTGEGSVPIPVDGAEAIWFPGLSTAFILKGGYAGGITVLAAKDGDMQAAAASLAPIFASRMP